MFSIGFESWGKMIFPGRSIVQDFDFRNLELFRNRSWSPLANRLVSSKRWSFSKSKIRSMTKLFSVKNRFNYAYQQEYPYRINHLLEAEFFLLELMVNVSISLDFLEERRVSFQDCCLIVYHPYRPLLQFFQDLPPDDGLLQMAW